MMAWLVVAAAAHRRHPGSLPGDGLLGRTPGFLRCPRHARGEAHRSRVLPRTGKPWPRAHPQAPLDRRSRNMRTHRSRRRWFPPRVPQAPRRRFPVGPGSFAADAPGRRLSRQARPRPAAASAHPTTCGPVDQSRAARRARGNPADHPTPLSRGAQTRGAPPMHAGGGLPAWQLPSAERLHLPTGGPSLLPLLEVPRWGLSQDALNCHLVGRAPAKPIPKGQLSSADGGFRDEAGSRAGQTGSLLHAEPTTQLPALMREEQLGHILAKLGGEAILDLTPAGAGRGQFRIDVLQFGLHRLGSRWWP